MTTTALVRYEAARTALAECQRIDEVKDIRDKAEAMAAYARQAKDTELIQYATEIKVRAERRAGEMLAQSAERGERAGKSDAGRRSANERWGSKSDAPTSYPPTLGDMGITKDQSSRWQSLAGMSDEHFETAVATAKDTAGQVTTAFMLREAQRVKPGRKTTKRDQERLQELQEAKARGVSMLSTYARLTLTALRAQSEFTEEEVSILGELSTVLQQLSENL
jgi:hypothetical protein